MFKATVWKSNEDGAVTKVSFNKSPKRAIELAQQAANRELSKKSKNSPFMESTYLSKNGIEIHQNIY